MNLITFGFSEKGTPVFLNQEPYPQVGTLYVMKAGKNSVIGITLDYNLLRPAKAPARAKRGRKPRAIAAEAAPKKRGRKSKAEVAEAAPKKKVRKPGKPKAKKGKKAKMDEVEAATA